MFRAEYGNPTRACLLIGSQMCACNYTNSAVFNKFEGVVGFEPTCDFSKAFAVLCLRPLDHTPKLKTIPTILGVGYKNVCLEPITIWCLLLFSVLI